MAILEKYGEFEIVPEPLEEWLNVKGENLMNLFYENPRKFAFLLQVWILYTMMKTHQKEAQAEIRVMERSMYRYYLPVHYCHTKLVFVAKDSSLFNC